MVKEKTLEPKQTDASDTLPSALVFNARAAVLASILEHNPIFDAYLLN